MQAEPACIIADHPVVGSMAWGNIDYMLMYHALGLMVIEVKCTRADCIPAFPCFVPAFLCDEPAAVVALMIIAATTTTTTMTAAAAATTATTTMTGSGQQMLAMHACTGVDK
jgi:hypothetical protein